MGAWASSYTTAGSDTTGIYLRAVFHHLLSTPAVPTLLSHFDLSFTMIAQLCSSPSYQRRGRIEFLLTRVFGIKFELLG